MHSTWTAQQCTGSRRPSFHCWRQRTWESQQLLLLMLFPSVAILTGWVASMGQGGLHCDRLQTGCYPQLLLAQSQSWWGCGNQRSTSYLSCQCLHLERQQKEVSSDSSGMTGGKYLIQSTQHWCENWFCFQPPALALKEFKTEKLSIKGRSPTPEVVNLCLPWCSWLLFTIESS